MLDLTGISPENQALVYSNRSVAYLKLGEEKYFEMAKRDATFAIQLWPCWWRGYFRLGCAEMKLGDLKEAEKALKKALVLEPGSKEASDVLSDVRREVNLKTGF